MIPINPPDPGNPLNQTIVEMVRASAQTFPESEAVVCGPIRLTWAAFDARINKVANMLLARGMSRGDNIAILSPNSVAFAEVFMGILRAGGCVTPMSTMASPDTLLKMLVDCDPKVLFLANQYRELTGSFMTTLSMRKVALDFSEPGFEDYETSLSEFTSVDPKIRVGLDDPFNLIYSSGTTGSPKGILHSHRMRAAQMDRVTANGYDDNARTLLSTPLYSNTTIVSFLPTLVGGSTVHLMRKFDAREFLQIVERERITHTMLVPVQYKRIMEVADFDRFNLSSMRVKFSTSAPLRADVKADVVARFPGKLIEYYGLTEGGGVTVLVADENPDKLHTVGRPAPGCEIRLIGTDGGEVNKGAVGEVCGRSPSMMAGYFRRDDLTSAYLWRDRIGRVYFRSGDMGYFDDDGFLVLSDRKKDMIISGGLNIYANDLELVLLADPDVADAAVIGVPSDVWGETPLGLVVLRAGAIRTTTDIRDRANAQLGKSQRLSAVEARDHLPRSSIGKILKRELRAPHWPDTAQ